MRTLAEVFREHDFDRLECHDHLGRCCPAGCHGIRVNQHEHYAAVVAEWLRSVEVREVVTDWLPDRSNIHARAILAALAAHAKGDDDEALP